MNTIFLLLAEFGQADVPVETVCSRYLGLDERQAKRQASLASLQRYITATLFRWPYLRTPT